MFKRTILLLSAFLMISFTSLVSAGENEGITCLNEGSRDTAEYDLGSNGRDVTKSIKIGQTYGGSKCMGRCGGGCDKWWAASAWAKDCLDHDICIVDTDNNDYAADENCGDEFVQAADDYIFGVVRGCSG